MYYQPPPWGYQPQGPYTPWMPQQYPAGCNPPAPTGNPIKDLKRAIKFYKTLQKEEDKIKEDTAKKKPSWKERVDMYILLAILTPVIIPLYSIMVHRLWEIAK